MTSTRLRVALLLASLLQAACATPKREYPPEKMSVGRMAAVGARFEPSYTFYAAVEGRSDAAKKASGRILPECFGAATEIFRHPLGPLALLVLPVMCPTWAGGAALSAAVGSASADDINAARTIAQRGIEPLRFQEAALDAVVRYGNEMGTRLDRLPAELGPAHDTDLPAYPQATAGVADSVIEISVLSARAFTPGAASLRLTLGMEARVRFLEAASGRKIDALFIPCESSPRTVEDWVASEGRAIRSFFDWCVTYFAEQALDEVLYLHYPKDTGELVVDPPEAEVPPYALRPIHPPVRNIPLPLTIVPGVRQNYGNLEYYALGTLQPEFQWEAWPRGFDVSPGDGPGKAQNVRYDLRVLADGIAYERRGLTATSHKLEQPLAPCGTYRWTVRARFLLDGQQKVTEWMGVYDTIYGVIQPWSIRRGRDTRGPRLVRGPPLPKVLTDFYPIVETPCARPAQEREAG